MKQSDQATKSYIGLTMTGILLAASACVSGPPENATPVGPERVGVYPLAGIDKIVLELPAGAANIVRGASGQLSMALEIACASSDDSCRELAGKVVLEERRSEGQLTVGPSTQSRFAYRNAQTDYRIEVPDDIPLQVTFGYGELNVHHV
ncbi:MAG: hypothetical protein HKN70_11820, partial [Gammaproteobacteria bacterium]|nr:hypothetical protein [Gammaproteobacteria bacterium]